MVTDKAFYQTLMKVQVLPDLFEVLATVRRSETDSSGPGCKQSSRKSHCIMCETPVLNDWPQVQPLAHFFGSAAWRNHDAVRQSVILQSASC